ncbi:hypothetical protein COCVIDRAFT_36084 [Bipolaris victoriae FI3]|uniref:Uncharacterized protein n=1 Tax=Bipolaris victoriae (strain FI3) TaxID=930091 RepID=W7EY76_BIPV3|nr:hypothetical protein COCVIDRAFT_36084 [Bipolaris victoriae FI3]
MFTFSGNLLAGQYDTQKQRSPPPKPTPVTFPALHPPEPSTQAPPASWSQPGARITDHFLRLKKPSDVTEETLALLNVTFQPESDLETFLSSLSNNAESFLPPRSWFDSPGEQQSSSNTGTPPKLLSNGRKPPEQRDFFVRSRELFFNNADAFSTLTRKGCGTQPPLRLAHFRKFWEGLDNLAYYWDTSLDEYLPPAQGANSDERTAPNPLSGSTDTNPQEASGETNPEKASAPKSEPCTLGTEEPRKKAKVGDTRGEKQSIYVQGNNGSGRDLSKEPAHPERIHRNNVDPLGTPRGTNKKAESMPADVPRGTYRGYRIGNGAGMPDQYRIECVRSFLEPIAWAFGVTLFPHRRPPVLTIEHIRFPVRMSSVAWRGPQDRVKARQGCLEGPVLGMQCRADVNFGATGRLEAQSTLDAVRELGGLLLLAQERAREGKCEQRAGEGKWWTTKERWGGGPGGEVGEAIGAAEILEKEAISKLEEKPVERNRDGSKARRRPTPAEVWKTLRPGNPLWDPKVTYEAIGKDRSIAWDDVFMVSSLNHHISLLRLRIHPAYLELITEGRLPVETPPESDWCSPKLQRTRWFDLFNIEDRAEAMRGVWGIMSYLMRTDSAGHENAGMSE